MNKYKWDLIDIRKKQRYVEERLKKNNISPLEKEKLQLSLVCYFNMLNNCGNFRYTKVYNFLDILSDNKFSLKRDSKYIYLENTLAFSNNLFIDKEYLKFLIEIVENIASANVRDLEGALLNRLDMSNSEILNLCRKFYYDFNDSDILSKALLTLDSHNYINFSNTYRRECENYRGLTFDDFYFNKSYITLVRSNNIFDLQAVAHEVMHTVDFYTLPKLPSKNHYGFDEVCTYTMDYLFIDYLDGLGFNKFDVQIMRLDKEFYLKYLANLVIELISDKLTKFKGYKKSIDFEVDDIYDVIDNGIKKIMLEVLSGVMAYGLYLDICSDKKIGTQNLKKFMGQLIPNYKSPDFSYINLDNDRLINLSKEFGKYSMKNVDYVNKKFKK